MVNNPEIMVFLQHFPLPFSYFFTGLPLHILVSDNNTSSLLGLCPGASLQYRIYHTIGRATFLKPHIVIGDISFVPSEECNGRLRRHRKLLLKGNNGIDQNKDKNTDMHAIIRFHFKPSCIKTTCRFSYCLSSPEYDSFYPKEGEEHGPNK